MSQAEAESEDESECESDSECEPESELYSEFESRYEFVSESESEVMYRKKEYEFRRKNCDVLMKFQEVQQRKP